MMSVSVLSGRTRAFPEQNICRFGGGLATEQARTRLLNEAEIKAVLLKDDNPYIGLGVPTVFSKRERKQALQALDQAARCLRQIDVALYRRAGFAEDFRLPALKLKLGTKTAQLDYVASGNFGAVFKLTLGKQHYAFKVFFKRDRDHLYSGPYSEAALGAYITAKNVVDMPHLLMAHPQEGWLLSEFIDVSFQNPRRRDMNAPTWKSLGLQVLDPQYTPANELTDGSGMKYRVDYGHLTTSQRTQPERSADVDKLFRSPDPALGYIPLKAYWDLFVRKPETRSRLFANIACLHPNERLIVIERVLNYPEMQDFPVQDFFQFDALKKEAQDALFQLLIAHPDLKIRAKAIFLPQNTRQRQQFESVWKSDPVFLPFRVFRGETGLLPQLLAACPVLSIQ